MHIKFGPDFPKETYVPHDYDEQLVDLGEVRMNYAVAGSPEKPALLLIPGQTESWWGYEKAMKVLEKDFQVFVVDLRGQGRSTRTPGRYTLDNFGNDLVRFIAAIIKRPVIVSGLSSGAVIAAWLSAYASPGTIRGTLCEDPPFFHSETNPACGQSIRQGVGPMFAHLNKYLGDQWSIGDWKGLVASAPSELPEWMMLLPIFVEEPPQTLKEYDPEWGRAFSTGTVAASCDHAQMLSSVKTPVLMTHHFHIIEEGTGYLLGAISDLQVQRAKALIESTGCDLSFKSFPEMGHSLHDQDPELYVKTLSDWAATLA
ncbi:MAG: alpha/beta hydrolase [Parvibaculaceae bacterium]|nr:alpha/beta hydrolase [Parvibaculaceae bacterium]